MLQQFLDAHYPAFAPTHPLPAHVREAGHALRSCRTATVGGQVQACPDGHVERVWYNSCRHRFCPQGAQPQIAQWLEKQKARLLRCDHYHVIFTLPRELNGLWLANGRERANRLFRTAWATLSELLGDPKYRGAPPGMRAAVHPWGQTLVLHPHLHCLVTGGGLAGDTWKAVHNGYLLPARVVLAGFCGTLLAAVHAAWEAGQLSLPPGVSAPQLRMGLHRLGRTNWPVQIRPRSAHGQGVATYLARYLRGGPLKPGRVVSWDAQTVTFRYADNQDPDAQGRERRKLLPLSVEDFLPRWLLHVPPPGLQVVRSYGLYAPSKGAAVEQGGQALGHAPGESPLPLDWQTYLCAAGAATSGALSGVWAAPDPHGHSGPRPQPRPSRTGASTTGPTRTVPRVAGGGMTPRDRLLQPLTVRSRGERVAGARPPHGLVLPAGSTQRTGGSSAPLSEPRDASCGPAALSA